MFDFRKKVLEDGQTIKYTLYQRGDRLCYIDFLILLQREKTFRLFFIELLPTIPFSAYQWETPPVTLSTTKRPFEFVATNAPSIDLPPDSEPFESYLKECDTLTEMAVFSNLGGDATLIAPPASGEKNNYSHLAKFTQEAPEKQQLSLWQLVGKVTEDHLSEKPLWLNTAGGGVSWLHIRLDTVPKYYRHYPYLAN